MNEVKYTFREINLCNMCLSGKSRILGKRLNKSQGLRPGRKTGITVSVVQCKTCGLIYSNPMPIPLNIQDHYGVPPESYWKDQYFTVDENYFGGEIKRLKSLISFQAGMKSLDVGAGIGKGMIALSRAGFDAYGLEPSSSFHERAISKMNISADKLKLGMVEEIDYPENYFDFISFGAVLEHLYDPSNAIKQTLKWLKPNGLIHIEVPSSDWLVSRLINFYYKVTFRDYVGNISPMHVPFHLYEFTLNSFKENGKRLNYDIAFNEYFVCETYLPRVVDIFIKPYMRRTNTGMQLSIWLRKK